MQKRTNKPRFLQKQFKANLIKEQAEITEELIKNLTQAHTKQMEALIKSTTDAMKEMMMLVKANTNNQIQNNWNQSNFEFIGGQGGQIWLIIGPNIMHQHTT
jgi:hypothetical protein